MVTYVLSGYAKYLGDNVRQICLQSSWLGNSAIEAQVLFNLARDFLSEIWPWEISIACFGFA